MGLPVPASARLFLCLWPPAELRGPLAEHVAAWSWPAAARRTPPGRLHVTVQFLGNVAACAVPALRMGLDVPWEGCELLLDRAQVWPGGIAVLEAGEVPPQLARLHANLGARLEALGIAVDTRRYRPHLTLARKAAGARPPRHFTPLGWRAAPAYMLVRSLPGGLGYETIQAFG